MSMGGGLLANQQSAEQAQKNRDFQLMMSSTAYQRGTADMKAAGLNPMLAYSQGGASTAGGATASMQDVVSPAIDRYNATLTQSAQRANIDADTTVKNATGVKVNADTDNVERIHTTSNWMRTTYSSKEDS